MKACQNTDIATKVIKKNSVFPSNSKKCRNDSSTQKGLKKHGIELKNS